MARVTLTREEYTTGELPPVCVVCGEYTQRKQWCDFSTVPLGVILWGLSAPWMCFILPFIFAFVILSSSRTATVLLPVCYEHRYYWIWRGAFLCGVLLSTWVNFAWSLKFGGNELWEYGMNAMLLLATIALFVVPHLEVRMQRFVDDTVTLAGTHPDFVAAVEDARNTKPRGDADGG